MLWRRLWGSKFKIFPECPLWMIKPFVKFLLNTIKWLTFYSKVSKWNCGRFYLCCMGIKSVFVKLEPSLMKISNVVMVNLWWTALLWGYSGYFPCNVVPAVSKASKKIFLIYFRRVLSQIRSLLMNLTSTVAVNPKVKITYLGQNA